MIVIVIVIVDGNPRIRETGYYSMNSFVCTQVTEVEGMSVAASFRLGK